MLPTRWLFALVGVAAVAAAAAQFPPTQGSAAAPPVTATTPPTTAKEQSSDDRVAAALAMKVDVALDGATLDDVAAWARKQSGVDVVVDRKALLDGGFDADTIKLSLSLRQVSLEAALWHLLQPQNLVATVIDGAVYLTTADKAMSILTPKAYAVGDLITWRDEFGREHRELDSLPEFLYSTCAPTTWSDVGGHAGDIQILGDVMVVSQTWDVHRQIAATLALLRQVLKQQAAGDYGQLRIPQPGEGDVRVTRALQRKVDIDVTDMPLAKFAKLVSELSEVNVIVDRKSFADAGFDADEVKITGKASGVPLDQALWKVFREPELYFATIHEVLVLFPVGTGCQWPTWSIYPVADLNVALGVNSVDGDDRTPVEDLTSLITATVGPTTWEAGSGPGSVRYLAPWNLLLIPQTEYYHREIESLLANIRRLRADQRRADPGNAADADPIELRVYSLEPAQQAAGESTGPTAKEVAKVVRELVEPQSWTDNDVYLRPLGDRIVVRHRLSVQGKVRRLMSLLQAPERVERDYWLSPAWQSTEMP
ncbi:MAG: hypothetical protein WD875_17065 [Pirellulales bacterium]